MRTSILVSMYNKNESVIQAIDKMFFPSLIKNGSYDKEVIILDDFSPLKKRTNEIVQKHIPKLKTKFGRVVFLRNKKNLGFASSYNRAISMAKGENLVITNDDIYFPKGSIDQLVSTISNDKKMGIVAPITGEKSTCTYQYCKQGPKLTEYSKKNFQEIENFAKKIREIMKYESVKKAEVITGFCFITKKEMIENVGGYDKRFGFGFLEDTDLVRRIGQKYDTMIAPSIYIHHGAKGGASASVGQYPIKSKISYFVNCYKYAKKWNDFMGIIKLWNSSVHCLMGYNTVSELLEKKLNISKKSDSFKGRMNCVLF